MFRVTLIALVLALIPATAIAQDGEYQPTHETPDGAQLVVVFISSTWCVGSRTPGLHDAIETIKLNLSNHAAEEGAQFRAIGVALDWPADSGIAYLSEFGKWDQIIAGGNWFNLGAEELIWADNETQPSIPQVIIYRREITSNPEITFSGRDVIRRVLGGEAIVEWANAEELMR